MNNIWGNNVKKDVNSPFHVSNKNNNVKNTNSGNIKNSYKSNKSENNSKYNNVFSSVRLSIRSIARLNAYQKLNGFKNRIDALNNLLDKIMPKSFKGKRHNEAITIEKIFENTHKGRSW